MLPLNSSASATSIKRDSVASSISSNDETDDTNSLLIEYNQIATSNYDSDNLLNSNDSIDEGCDISFPLAPTTLPSSHHHGRQLKVAIPPYTQSAEQQWYETGEYYATTCHDITTNKRRIDIRYLEQCFGGACWDTQIGVSFKKSNNIEVYMIFVAISILYVLPNTSFVTLSLLLWPLKLKLAMYICMHME